MAKLGDVVVCVKVRSESEVKAEVLREIAAIWYSDGEHPGPLSAPDWLRKKADQIEGKTFLARGGEGVAPGELED